MTSTLTEMGALLRSQPGPSAPTTALAAWLDRKATLFEHLSAEVTDPAERQGTARIAEQARQHAADLWAAERARCAVVRLPIPHPAPAATGSEAA